MSAPKKTSDQQPSLYEFLKSRSTNRSNSMSQSEKFRVEAMLEEIEEFSTIKNGSVIVYHATSSESAKKIHETKTMVGQEDGLFFSTKPDGEILGYGDVIVELCIPAENLHLDDVFEDEAHLRMPCTTGAEVAVENYLTSEIPFSYLGMSR